MSYARGGEILHAGSSRPGAGFVRGGHPGEEAHELVALGGGQGSGQLVVRLAAQLFRSGKTALSVEARAIPGKVVLVP
ncbi:hypothetical protein [Streptomyces pseudogriseolus]|uniref:hypothetical protein n=1 Tax=Streptomyces pseudogriseolus TaxID=36817 RepID=UPI003FA252AE